MRLAVFAFMGILLMGCDAPPPKPLGYEEVVLGSAEIELVETGVNFMVNDGEAHEFAWMRGYRVGYPGEGEIHIACGEVIDDGALRAFAGNFGVTEDEALRPYFVVTEIEGGGRPIFPPTLQDCARFGVVK